MSPAEISKPTGIYDIHYYLIAGAALLPGCQCARVKLEQFTDLSHQTDRIQKFTEFSQTRPRASPLENGKGWKRPWHRLVTCPLLHTKFLGVISEQWLIPWERSLFCKPLWSGKNDKHTNSNPIFTQQHSAVLGKFSSQISFFLTFLRTDIQSTTNMQSQPRGLTGVARHPSCFPSIT